jgi:hypothetical protein
MVRGDELAAAGVHRLGVLPVVQLERTNEDLGEVAHVDHVQELLAVAEDDERLVAQRAQDEVRDHLLDRRVLLPLAVRVEPAHDGDLRPEFLVVHEREALGRVLRDGVAVVPGVVADRDLHGAAAIPLHRLVQVQRAADVHLDALARRRDHLGRAEHAGEVDDAIVQTDRVGEGFGVAHVAEREADAHGHEHHAAVEDRHAVTALAEDVDDVAPDEPLAARDEHLHRAGCYATFRSPGRVMGDFRYVGRR